MGHLLCWVWVSENDILCCTCPGIFCHVNLVVALTGSVKDSVVGEERIVQYLLAVLNTRGTPLHWKHLNNRRIDGIEYECMESITNNISHVNVDKFMSIAHFRHTRQIWKYLGFPMFSSRIKNFDFLCM